MAALRELKPSFRQDRAKRKKNVIPTPEAVEVCLNPIGDTTLHYKGSPLMDPDIVLDPESLTCVKGDDTNYKTEPWLAVGLATENVEGANSNVVQEGNGGNPVGSPVEGSGGIHQPPISGALTYTEVGPSRSALYFDLSGIPAGAIITEAKLDMTPYDQDLGDLYGENTTANIWPSAVNAEILVLPQDSNENATWNTKDGDEKEVPFDTGTGIVVVPEPGKRWWRMAGGILPPNPIGVGQNTRRFDRPEPSDKMEEQINVGNFTTTGSNTIDGDPGAPEEYYGHIGYGISGGGYALLIDGIHDPAIPENGHPTFQISNTAFTTQQNSNQGNVFEVDVLDIAQWAHTTGNQQCNLLVRASSWDENTIAQTPDDQLTYPDNESFIEVTLTDAYISDSAGGSAITESENDQIIHVVDNAAGDPLTVTYTWQIQTPYVVMDDINDPAFPAFTIINAPFIREGETFQFDHGAMDGVPRRNGVTTILDNDQFTVTYSLDGTVLDTFTWTGSGTTPDGRLTAPIPQGTEGQNFVAELTIVNSLDTDDGSTDSVTFSESFSVQPDTVGTVNVTIDGNPTEVNEGTTITARATSTDVVNPQYRFELRFPTSSDIADSQDFSSNSSADFTVPEVSSGGSEQLLVRVELNNSDGVVVDTAITSAVDVNDVPDVGANNQMKFSYFEDRLSDTDPYGNVDNFTSISETRGDEFTDSTNHFPPSVAEGDSGTNVDGNIDINSLSFLDLNDDAGETIGAQIKLFFGAFNTTNRARRDLWFDNFYGINLTIRAADGSVVSTHTFSAEGLPSGSLSYIKEDSASSGHSIIWRNTFFGGVATNILSASVMQDIRNHIFNNCTQNDNGTQVFGESEFFFDIDYIPIPESSGGGGGGEVIDEIFGDGTEGSGTANAANSGSVMFETDTANINADSIMMIKIINFDGQFNPGFYGDNIGHKFLTPDMVEVFDKNSHPDLLGSARHTTPPATSSLRTFDVLSAPDFTATDGNQTYTSLSANADVDGNGTDESYNFPEIYVLYAPANDGPTFNTNLPTITSSYYNLNSSIGSQQTLVYEIIRDGAVVGRMKAEENAKNVGANHFGYDLAGGNYSAWFAPQNWAVEDTLVTMVVPTSVANAASVFDVPAP